MPDWARRFLILIAALPLALPTGWCCRIVDRPASTAAKTPVEDCCGRHASLPAAAPAAADDQDTPAAPEIDLPDLVSVRDVRAVAVHIPPLPLRLLHCTWLC
jgi:hypothetical protein